MVSQPRLGLLRDLKGVEVNVRVRIGGGPFVDERLERVTVKDKGLGGYASQLTGDVAHQNAHGEDQGVGPAYVTPEPDEGADEDREGLI